MVIELYSYLGVPQVINKSIAKIRTLSGRFRNPYNVMNPTLTVTGTFDTDLIYKNQINYIEIEGKYYYLIDWTINHSGAIEMILHMDVLMTYKDEINKMEVMLERSDKIEGKPISDNMHPLSNEVYYERDRFPNSFNPDPEYGTYVLVSSQAAYYSPGGLQPTPPTPDPEEEGE